MSAHSTSSRQKDRDLLDRVHKAIPDIIKEVLIARQAAGLLTPYTEHKDYRFSYVRIWNRFIANPGAMKIWEMHDLLAVPHMIFSMKILTIAQNIRDEMGETDAAFDAVMEQARPLIEEGTNPYGPGMSGEISSPIIKGKFYAVFKDWSLSIIQINPEANFTDRSIPRHIEPAPISVKPVVHMPIDLPTGKLIIADWIRIPAFTDAVAREEYDISYAQERLMRTVAGVKAHNLIEVACGNSMPSILLEADKSGAPEAQLRIGLPVYEPDSDTPVNPDLKEIGTVTTDVNGVAIIDEADLAAILAAQGLDPQTEIQTWETGQWRNGVTRLTVAPGQWHLYFVEFRGYMGVAEIERVSQDLGTGFETIVLLTQTPIDLDPDQTLEA